MSEVRQVLSAQLAWLLSKEGPPGYEGSSYSCIVLQGRLARPLLATSISFDKCWVSANGMSLEPQPRYGHKLLGTHESHSEKPMT